MYISINGEYPLTHGSIEIERLILTTPFEPYLPRTKAYISGPISNGDKCTPEEVVDNVELAMDAAMLLMRAGLSPICPQLSHFWNIHMINKGQEFLSDDFLLLDLSILTHCDILLRLPGDSRGADVEVEYAVATLEIPVSFSADEVIDFDRARRSSSDREREYTSFRNLLAWAGHTPQDSGRNKGSADPNWFTRLRH